MSLSTLPDYINYGNDIVTPVPGIIKHATLYTFAVEGSMSQIQKMCDQRLNFAPERQNKRYVPFSNMVLLVFSVFPQGYTADKNYSKKGMIGETALNIFVPLLESEKDSKGIWVPKRMVLFIPYIMVDNCFSAVLGREAYGFPKAWGEFQLPATPDFAASFMVSAFGLKKFGAEQVAANHLFMHIQKQSASTAEKIIYDADRLWKALKNTVFGIIATNGSLLSFVKELEKVKEQGVNLIFLKQFRDIQNTNKACYQAITEAPGKVTAFRRAGVLEGNYRIHLPDFASYPLKTELGIDDNSLAQLAVWAEVDMELGLGKEIWKA